jgi:hypothetical protein
MKPSSTQHYRRARANSAGALAGYNAQTSSGERGGSTVARMKDRQTRKIRQIREGLIAEGFRTLDEQAKVLGISRSTTWTVLRGEHKSSGLSVTIINRMLAARRLPPSVRAILVEYIEEKAAGLYGHNKMQRSRFTRRLKTAGPGG